MPDCVAQQASEDAGHSIHTIVCDETERLFSLLVEYGHDEHESWVHYSLRHSKEEAVGCDASEVLACWGCDDEDTPSCNISSADEGIPTYDDHTQNRSADESPGRQMLEQVTCWVLGEQVAEVEDG